MDSNLVKEIERIENLAGVDIIKLSMIIGTINRVFTRMRFKGEFPRIIADNCHKDGQAEECPAYYCDDEKKIIINMSAPKHPLSCSSVVLASCVAWAAAMHVFYERGLNKRSPEGMRAAAEKLAKSIAKDICC